MKSKISFCNVTVIKKDITRFWPLWAVEFIFLQLIGNISLYFNLANIFRDEINSAANKLLAAQDAMAGMLVSGSNVFVTAVVAVVGAIMVFGYLWRKVSAYAIHSLPVSRTALFVSHYAAGFLMITVPYILTFLTTGVINMIYGLGMGTAIFGAFLRVFIMIVFFYSLSCLIVMFSGTGEMSALIYGVLNILVWGGSVLLKMVLTYACYGMGDFMLSNTFGGIIEYLTPIVHFLKVTDIGARYGFLGFLGIGVDVQSTGEQLIKAPWLGLGQSAGYLVPAILFILAAWYLYQKRPLENTGDVMAFSWCKIVFRIVFSICGSMLLTLMFWAVSREFLGHVVTYQTAYIMMIVLLALFSAASYLISEMLLTKSFMIWKKISFRQMGIVCVVMPAAFIASYMVYQKNSALDVQNIESMNLQFCGISYEYRGGKLPEGLEELHREIQDGWDKETLSDDYYDNWEESLRFYLEYRTKDEEVQSRTYKITLAKQPELSEKIQKFFNEQDDKIEKIFPKGSQYDAEHIMDIMLQKGDDSVADGKEWSDEEKLAVFKAVTEDLNEENIVPADVEAYMDSDNRRSITLWFDPDIEARGFVAWDYGSFAQELYITDKSIHTLSALEKLEIEF